MSESIASRAPVSVLVLWHEPSNPLWKEMLYIDVMNRCKAVLSAFVYECHSYESYLPWFFFADCDPEPLTDQQIACLRASELIFKGVRNGE